MVAGLSAPVVRKSLILQSNWLHSESMQLYTDASGTQGWGAYWSGRWLQRSWSTTQQTRDITWKELFATVMAVHTRGIYWTKQKIVFRCDNQAVVDIWEKGTTYDSYNMALVRLPYFRAAQYNINVCVMHMLNKNTPGVKKSEAKSEAPESYSYKRLKSVISGGGQGPSCLLATM